MKFRFPLPTFAVSHETTETLDDPFIDNVVPPWEFPGALPAIVYGNFLETGDPLENLPNPSFPVTKVGSRIIRKRKRCSNGSRS